VRLAQSVKMMGMDSSAGMPAAEMAKIYKAVIEGDSRGKILDVRTFF